MSVVSGIVNSGIIQSLKVILCVFLNFICHLLEFLVLNIELLVHETHGKVHSLVFRKFSNKIELEDHRVKARV